MKREMIQEGYVTSETFSLLKQVGYPLRELENKSGYYIPSQAQAMRWLREDRNINIRINWHSERKMWFFDMLNIAHTYDYFESEDYHRAYEDAAEKGIQIACRYLKPKAMETKTKPLRRSLSDILDIKAKE